MGQAKYVFINGEIVPYDQGKIHVNCEAVKFGGSVFEGLRAYWNSEHQELYVFRMREHIERLLSSMRVMRMEHNFTYEDLEKSIVDLLRANDFKEDIYIRQTAYLEGEGLMESGPVGLSVVAHPTKRSQKVGMSAHVSSWGRIADNVMPPRVKCAANYQNSRLVMLESKASGYDMGLILNSAGKLSEAPGAACFVVRGGQLLTPPVTADILESITRDSVIEICEKELGKPTFARDVDRSELYLAEEMFICGTAFEIVPILSIEKLKIGDGMSPGSLTAHLIKHYFEIARGQKNEYMKWLTPLYGKAKALPSAA